MGREGYPPKHSQLATQTRNAEGTKQDDHVAVCGSVLHANSGWCAPSTMHKAC